MGVGMAFIWSPLAATATRNLPPGLAGAGSGVYNATRQVGAVLGSARMAAFMTSRITAEMPALPDGASAHRPEGPALQLPEFLREPFAAAMSQSMLLPAFIALFGVGAALFMVGFTVSPAGRRSQPVGGYAGTERIRAMPNVSDDFDDYVEYVVPRAPEPRVDEHDTEPLTPLKPAPPPASKAEPIGFAHNGFHVDDEKRVRPVAQFPPPRRNRHYRADPDEGPGYERNSSD